MRISRDKARERVERALSEADPDLRSARWDAAWSGIRALEARNMGEDCKVAYELAARMRAAARES